MHVLLNFIDLDHIICLYTQTCILHFLLKCRRKGVYFFFFKEKSVYLKESDKEGETEKSSILTSFFKWLYHPGLSQVEVKSLDPHWGFPHDGWVPNTSANIQCLPEHIRKELDQKQSIQGSMPHCDVLWNIGVASRGLTSVYHNSDPNNYFLILVLRIKGGQTGIIKRPAEELLVEDFSWILYAMLCLSLTFWFRA